MITIATTRVKNRFTVEAPGTGAPISAKPFIGSAGVYPRLAVSTGSPGATVVAKPAGAAGGVQVAPAVSASGGANWSATNNPATYTSTSQLTTDAGWAGANIVNLQTGAGDFYTNLANTVAAAGGRCVVRLVGGTTYHLTSFRLVGSSGDPTYAFGFWFSNLQGFISSSTTPATIQMDANSMSTAQLSALQSMTPTSGSSPNQMGLCRIDGSSASPILLAGVIFQSADQQNLTSQAAGASPAVVVPQPAPHQGVVFYYGATSYISYCKFIGVGRAATSSPPFEQGNLSTARGTHHIHNCEFDGRRAASIDPAQPRRCGPIMLNNETEHHMVDCWVHDSNISRYASNDQNIATNGIFEITRVKSERISNVHNIDPALNGGASLGGYTNASNFGWEDCSGTITITDSIISVDDPYTDGQSAFHLQLTYVGGRANPQGGRMHVKGGTYHQTAFTQLEGYVTVRIGTNTYWWTDGPATTLDVRDSNNNPLTGWQFTGTWPPTSGQLAAAGISPTTTYIYQGV